MYLITVIKIMISLPPSPQALLPIPRKSFRWNGSEKYTPLIYFQCVFMLEFYVPFFYFLLLIAFIELLYYFTILHGLSINLRYWMMQGASREISTYLLSVITSFYFIFYF